MQPVLLFITLLSAKDHRHGKSVWLSEHINHIAAYHRHSSLWSGYLNMLLLLLPLRCLSSNTVCSDCMCKIYIALVAVLYSLFAAIICSMYMWVSNACTLRYSLRTRRYSLAASFLFCCCSISLSGLCMFVARAFAVCCAQTLQINNKTREHGVSMILDIVAVTCAFQKSFFFSTEHKYRLRCVVRKMKS